MQTPNLLTRSFLFISFILSFLLPIQASTNNPSENGCAETDQEMIGGYLLTYIKPGETQRSCALYIAHSKDGKQFTELNNGKAIKYPMLDKARFGNPQLVRKPDGEFALIAINKGTSDLLVFDSKDLTSFKNERLINLPQLDSIDVVSIQCKYDELTHRYVIRWEDASGLRYESSSDDLQSINDAHPLDDFTQSNYVVTVPDGAVEYSVISLSAAEYNNVLSRYMTVENTGVAPLADIHIKRKQKDFDLPQRATLLYNNGTTKELGVVWSEEDVNKVNTKLRGTYYVNGQIQQPIYRNPFIEGRADPWIIKGDDGYYYFTATYPMTYREDPEGCDRVVLRRSKTIAGLIDAPEINIWDEKNSDISSRFVWAPELHNINGTWYVLVTTSRNKDNVWGIRPLMIACSKGDKDPINPDCWETDGNYCMPFENDSKAFANFSLDMTYFEAGGKHYVIWAEIDGFSNLRIASIDPNEPWKMTSPSMLLTKPEFAWEWDNDRVNEGAAVIKRNGKVYVTFSASSVNKTYCVGLMIANESDNLVADNVWEKVGYPILDSVDLLDECGPGHNSFTIDEYGNPLLIYHARNEKDNPGGLYDPDRHARIKSLNFGPDDMPILNMTAQQELNDSFQKVVVKIVVE